MVSHRGACDEIAHVQFREIGAFLRAGDALVINTSGALNAALAATRADGSPLELHLSTHLPGDFWTVEARTLSRWHAALPRGHDGRDAGAARRGERHLLHTPYPTPASPPRLWLATLRTPLPLHAYLERFGFPIRYSYVHDRWPSRFYQTAYVTEMGSAEAPSAGRAFTPELMVALVARGVLFAPLLLHTGVSSLEDHEPPYEEYYRVPEATARLLTMTRAAGGRVIAVGTTAVRALETVTDERGVVHPGEGWTDVIITPERGLRAVDGLLTGLHEPRSSHLAMLEALTGREGRARPTRRRCVKATSAPVRRPAPDAAVTRAASPPGPLSSAEARGDPGGAPGFPPTGGTGGQLVGRVRRLARSAAARPGR